MKNRLIQDINAYISHLNQNGLFVTVHGKGISGLLEYNIHRNPFCSLVKTDDEAWQKCIRNQQKVFKEHQRKCFFGMCHAGMEEYIFFVNDRCFISVSGYGIHRDKAIQRIHRLTQDHFLNQTDLLHIYDNSLKHQSENTETLRTVIQPLCHMLYLLHLLLADIPETDSENSLFDAMLHYVQRNFMQALCIQNIAQACACSASTVSHVFKQYTGLSVKQYIVQLRINQAKKLLRTSDLPIGTVALLCGFSNISYFPTAFKKHLGVSPTVYRAQTAIL